MTINDKDFILIVESLRSIRAMIDLNSPYTRNIKLNKEDIINLIERLINEYQSLQAKEIK
jgi:hypothetical protein